MEKVTLSPASRARILENIRAMDLSSERETVKSTPVWKKMLPVAAMAALVLSGVISWQWWSRTDIIPDDTPIPMDSGDNVDPDSMETVREADSLASLEELLGFPVEELTGLPFVAERTVYRAYWYGMGETVVTGEGQTAKFRKQQGSEDISGILDAVYPSSADMDAGGTVIALRGIMAGDRYNTASWQWGGYAYSLELSDGVDADAFLKIIQETIPGMNG